MATYTRVLPGSFQPNWPTTNTAWYRADLGVTVTSGHVTAVADQSGTGNNLANNGTGLTLATQAGANNQQGFVYDGTSFLYTNTPVIIGTDQSSTYIAVCKTSDATTNIQGVWGNGAVTDVHYNTYLLNDSSSNRCYYNDKVGPQWVTAADLTTNFEISVWVNTSTGVGTVTRQLFLNSTTAKSLTVTSNTADDTVLSNGGFVLGSFLFNVDSLRSGSVICEFICYNKALSTTEIKQTVNYLNSRYALF